jgi:hypothetical protein
MIENLDLSGSVARPTKPFSRLARHGKTCGLAEKLCGQDARAIRIQFGVGRPSAPAPFI